MRDVAKSSLDDTFATTLTGTSQQFEESSNSLAFAFFLALILVYLILSAQFEELSRSAHHYVYRTSGIGRGCFVAMDFRTNAQHIQRNWNCGAGRNCNEEWNFDCRVCQPKEAGRHE